MTTVCSASHARIVGATQSRLSQAVESRAAPQSPPSAACSLGFGICLSGTQLRGARRLRASAARGQACVLAASEGANPFAKFGRVLQEKAKADFDRVFKVRAGASGGKEISPRLSALVPCVHSELDTVALPSDNSVSLQGTSKTRERLAVVDELLTYWKVRSPYYRAAALTRHAQADTWAPCRAVGRVGESPGGARGGSYHLRRVEEPWRLCYRSHTQLHPSGRSLRDVSVIFAQYMLPLHRRFRTPHEPENRGCHTRARQEWRTEDWGGHPGRVSGRGEVGAARSLRPFCPVTHPLAFLLAPPSPPLVLPTLPAG